MIERDLYLYTYGIIDPLRVVYASNEQTIKFNIKDFDLTSSHTVKFYNRARDGRVFEQTATVDATNDAVSFVPDAGFFVTGENELQIEVTSSSYKTYSFIIPVYCEENVIDDDSIATAQTVLAASTLASQTLAQITTVKNSIPSDYSTLSNAVNNMDTRINELIDTKVGGIENGTY